MRATKMKIGGAAVSSFFFFFLEFFGWEISTSLSQNAPPVSGTLAGFCVCEVVGEKKRGEGRKIGEKNLVLPSDCVWLAIEKKMPNTFFRALSPSLSAASPAVSPLEQQKRRSETKQHTQKKSFTCAALAAAARRRNSAVRSVAAGLNAANVVVVIVAPPKAPPAPAPPNCAMVSLLLLLLLMLHLRAERDRRHKRASVFAAPRSGRSARRKNQKSASMGNKKLDHTFLSLSPVHVCCLQPTPQGRPTTLLSRPTSYH